MSRKRQITAVIGGGAWGTALAAHLASEGREVRLWVLEDDLVDWIRSRRENPLYLPGVRLPESVRATSDLAQALAGVNLVVAVVPTQHSRKVLEQARGAIPAGCPVILANKGLEEDTLKLPMDIAAEALASEEHLAVLSGPSFAGEVARGRPAALVVAAASESLARSIQERISSPRLRLYRNTDPVGVQVAGALKNVIAIAAGAADGLGLGLNTQAAVITRGLEEITRLGMMLGGKRETFAGLAGLGDLVLTCTGSSSRNRAVGMELGKGRRLADILAGTRTVAEGVATARSARVLASRSGVDAPIVEEVSRILFEDGSPLDALERLMARPLTVELSSPGTEETTHG